MHRQYAVPAARASSVPLSMMLKFPTLKHQVLGDATALLVKVMSAVMAVKLGSGLIDEPGARKIG